MEDTTPQAVKVGYWTLGEYETSAYLDEWDGPHGLRSGTHQHSDEPVLVKWDERRQLWQEVDPVALIKSILEMADGYDRSGDHISGHDIRDAMRP